MNNKTGVIILSGIIFIGLMTLTAKTYNRSDKPAATGKMQVVASFYPPYFIASQIAGDKAEVSDIVPAGAEPHDYEPTARDMAKMESSRLIILNGANLEGWSDDIKKNLDAEKTAIVTAGEGLATRQTDEGGRNAADPHVWLSPPLMKTMAERIAAAFMQADPANGDYYRANAGILKDKLSALDKAFASGLQDCQDRKIITSHAAFGYLADSYRFEQVPIAGLSPEAEPAPQQLAEIVRYAKENSVKYIFFESLASPRLAQTIAAEVGAQTLVLNPLEGLDDRELDQGKDYLSVMRDNLTNLQKAMQCQ